MHDVIGDPRFDHSHDLGAVFPLALHELLIQSCVLVKDIAVRLNVAGHVRLGHADRFEQNFFIDEVRLERKAPTVSPVLPS